MDSPLGSVNREKINRSMLLIGYNIMTFDETPYHILGVTVKSKVEDQQSFHKGSAWIKVPGKIWRHFLTPNNAKAFQTTTKTP